MTDTTVTGWRLLEKADCRVALSKVAAAPIPATKVLLLGTHTSALPAITRLRSPCPGNRWTSKLREDAGIVSSCILILTIHRVCFYKQLETHGNEGKKDMPFISSYYLTKHCEPVRATNRPTMLARTSPEKNSQRYVSQRYRGGGACRVSPERFDTIHAQGLPKSKKDHIHVCHTSRHLRNPHRRIVNLS
jgi:hypothetical protein